MLYLGARDKLETGGASPDPVDRMAAQEKQRQNSKIHNLKQDRCGSGGNKQQAIVLKRNRHAGNEGPFGPDASKEGSQR